MTHNLETDLLQSGAIKANCENSEAYTFALYAALCNNVWVHKETGDQWDCSWRYAGELVGEIADGGGTYYCSGNEGTVSREVEQDLDMLGWAVIHTAA